MLKRGIIMKNSNKSNAVHIKYEIAGRIKAIRKAKNITQEEIAELLEMSHNNYARIESGSQNITIYNLRAISKILSVSTDILLYGSNDESNNITLDEYMAFAETFNLKNLLDLRDKINYIVDLIESKNKS